MNIIAITPDRDQYILPLSNHLMHPLVFLRSLEWEELINLNPAAVLFLGDWLFEHEQLIIKCKEQNIPTILLMDGIIEWKHFFENPKWSFGGHEAPYFPVQCDKIFVPGASTYRFLEFFGNQGKCEITGFPRFDHYKAIENTSVNKNGKKVIGIMSGNTAGYTPEQIKQSKILFEDIFYWAQGNSEIEVLWRLRKGFEKILDIEITNEPSKDLIDFLSKTDAVVCQPSTAAYEAMLLGLPTALADYSIAPNYMHAAWEIHSKEQIDVVMKSITNPHPLKISLQQHFLDETLAWQGKSAETASKLINAIIEAKQQAPKQELPANMFMAFTHDIKENNQLTNALFTHQMAYRFNDINRLRESYTKLEQQLNRLTKALRRRTPGFWMERLINKVFK